MEPNDEKKKINEDLVVFMRKRSDTESPRYTARLKTYVDFQQKRRRAAAAREHHHHERKPSPTSAKKKAEPDQKDKPENRANTPNGSTKRKSNCGMSGEHPGSEDGRMSRRRNNADDKVRNRSYSRSRSEPSDGCCRRRRRKRKKCGRRRRRRRRRSCRRRRRRRRSCRRKRRRRRSRRRRRRSCSRRRRKRRCGH